LIKPTPLQVVYPENTRTEIQVHCTKRNGDNNNTVHHMINKKAQLSLTNPRDAKVCQKLLQCDDTGLSSFV